MLHRAAALNLLVLWQKPLKANSVSHGLQSVSSFKRARRSFPSASQTTRVRTDHTGAYKTLIYQ